MRRSVITLYALAAVFQATASSGGSMLVPFFMKERGFSLALVGIPLVINGMGRITSDLLSGALATYLSSGLLLITAAALALVGSILGIAFREVIPFFLAIWIVLGLTESMFALSIRKLAFDQSVEGQQGRAQGQIAAALGVGFTLGPFFGGWVGARWGVDQLFLVYALPQGIALLLILLATRSGVGRPSSKRTESLWQEGKKLFRRPAFLGACLGVFQTFLFLAGVTRLGFPLLAASYRGLSLGLVGTMVGISRLGDTVGRLIGGWVSDRFSTRSAVLSGLLLSVPMFVFQVHGTGFFTLLLPLCAMTLGFGMSNVGGVTCSLQTAGDGAKGIGLGLARASNSFGSMLGPLLAGVMIQELDYEGGFYAMGIISMALVVAVWFAFRRDRKPVK